MAAENGENYAKWNMNRLKDELIKNGLDASGKKTDLVTRMNNFVSEQLKKSDLVTEDAETMNTEQSTMNGSSEMESSAVDNPPEDPPEEKDLEEQMTMQVTEEDDTEPKADEEGAKNEAEAKDAEAPQTDVSDGSPKKEAKETPRGDKRREMPSKGDMKKELLGSERIRTVIVGPISIEESNAQELQNFQMQTERFHNRFFTIDGEKRGYSVLRFYTYEEAEQFVKDFTPPREDIKIRQFGASENGEAIMTKEINPPRSIIEERDEDEPIENRIMFVGAIPSTHASEEQLHLLFDDAQKIHLARSSETRESKGHAYVFYENHDAVVKAVDKYKDNVEADGVKLSIRKFVNNPTRKIDRSDRDSESYPMSDERRQQVEGEVKKIEKELDELKGDDIAEAKEKLVKRLRIYKRKLSSDSFHKKKMRKAGYVRSDRSRGVQRSTRGRSGSSYGSSGFSRSSDRYADGGYRGNRGGSSFRSGASGGMRAGPMMRGMMGGGPNPQMQQAVTKQALELLNNVSMALGTRPVQSVYDDGYRGDQSNYGSGYDNRMKRPMMSPGEVPMKRMRSNMTGGGVNSGAYGGGMRANMAGNQMAGPGAMGGQSNRGYGGDNFAPVRYNNGGGGYGAGNYGEGDNRGSYEDDRQYGQNRKRRGGAGAAGSRSFGGSGGRGGGGRGRGRSPRGRGGYQA